MGIVYAARAANGRLVALKVIKPEIASDPQFRARFSREVESGRRIKGRFAARVLDADTTSAVPYVVTEMVAGPSLRDEVWRSGPFAPTQLHALALGLADALVAVHQAGLVHRDVKPSNVLLARDGPRLIDFGIAYAAELTDLTKTGAVTGSPGWLAPEQATGRATASSADVFAWGATIALAGTGRAPFGDGRADAVLYRVVHDAPDLVGLDPVVHDVVSRALEKRPEDRPIAQQLVSWLSDQTVVSTADDGAPATAATLVSNEWRPDPAWTVLQSESPATTSSELATGRRTEGHRRLLAGAAVAVVAVLLVAGIAIAASRRSDDPSPVVTGDAQQLPTSSSLEPSTTVGAMVTIAAETTVSAPPTSAAADPVLLSSWVGTSTSPPPLVPDCPGVLGLCLGTPLERARAVLGPEDERFSLDGGTTAHYWTAPDGFTAGVNTDAAGGIESIYLGLNEDETELRVFLPGGLLLGQATMGDVRARRGEPVRGMLAGEGATTYTYEYRDGGEGSERVSFGLTHTWGDEDPGAHGDAIDMSVVRSFSVDYESSSEDMSAGDGTTGGPLSADLVGNTDLDASHWVPATYAAESRHSVRVLDDREWQLVYDFPVAMNGCATAQTRVRWRSLGGPVESGITFFRDSFAQYPVEIDGSMAPATDGTMLLSVCEQPVFRAAPGDSISDIVIDAEPWEPAVG